MKAVPLTVCIKSYKRQATIALAHLRHAHCNPQWIHRQEGILNPLHQVLKTHNFFHADPQYMGQHN